MRAAARLRLETIRSRLRFGVPKPQETAALREAARYFDIDMADERQRKDSRARGDWLEPTRESDAESAPRP